MPAREKGGIRLRGRRQFGRKAKFMGINKRRVLIFLLDVGFVGLAYTCAYLLRYDFDPHILSSEGFISSLCLALVVKPLVFWFSGLYRNLWRYASLQDAVEIFKTIFIAKVMVMFARAALGEMESFSRSIFLLDWLLLFTMMTASRMFVRVYRETYLARRKVSGARTLIIGAGVAGNMLLREIRHQGAPQFNVVGFIDDDKEKRGLRVNGVPVLGSSLELNSLIAKHCVETVVIAMPSAPRRVVNDLVCKCRNAKVRFMTVPGLGELMSGKVTVSQVKEVEIEDLLGREPVVLNEIAIRNYLNGKRVLVTGAAGSIGSEICRQVARFGPKKIVLLDNAETPLFLIERELFDKFPEVRVIPVIADVRREARVATVFDQFMPEVVFHAAAYKHVPMMEYCPTEAVTNNVGGTKIVADLAHKFGVANFVMISTDKAVNPTNVMGASKRVAERYVQALATHSATNFTTVRFGNVLGSNGSVIPLFKEQIRRGGPVTVTDHKVIRYFMTIPEAVQLVLQAGCIGNGGEIFVLDMGEPVRIVDLAEQLIRLSGFVPYEDIDIAFTGLRPGEKLFEELLVKGEGIKPTLHDKIKVLESVPSDLDSVIADLEELFGAALNSDVGRVMEILKQIVPEFTPSYASHGAVSPVLRRVRPDLLTSLERSAAGTETGLLH